MRDQVEQSVKENLKRQRQKLTVSNNLIIINKEKLGMSKIDIMCEQ